MALQSGDRIGDYEVTGILGAGGMGKVYKVRNVLSDRTEAMKVMLPALNENREVSDRFLREIRVLASFDHPHIAALHTAQHVDGQVLMVMEYIEGLSLDALLKRGRLALGPALNFCAQVLEALQYAHERGVVHRDLKPANIMVTKAGTVKLMDFGIAKLAADPKLTGTGTTFGSLHYMSPEQIQGAAQVDARSDLYSLGICLYEMVAGKVPFDADSEYSLMSAHLNQAPRPPVELDPTLPTPLNQLVIKSLLKGPTYRFQSAAEMLTELNRIRKDLGLLGADTAAVLPVVSPTSAPSPSTPPASTAQGLSSRPAVINPPTPPVPTGAAATPSPVAAAVAAAPPKPAAPRNRRMLYIAAGSVATAGVLVAALFLAPYLSRTSARTKAQEAPMPASSTELPAAAVPAPQQQPTTEPSTQPSTVVAQPEPQPEPQQPKATVAAPPQRPRESHAAATPGQAASGSTAPSAVQQQAVQQPAVQSPQPPAQQQQAVPQQSPARSAEWNQVREQYNQLAIRVSSTKSGLQSLQNQMGGLGLRADMREAATRADYLMQEAMSAIRAGDMDTAKRNIDMADRTVERIEKFLGR
jgi:serine/threonine-protein kinase